TTHGIPKILDFGLAKVFDPAYAPTLAPEGPLTGRGVAVGTVSYMSPEQLRGEEVDVRTDLFSLGLVLYEMATGQRAFDGATSAMITDAILHDEPKAPRAIRAELSVRLEEVILKALEKDCALRYQSAADLRADLMRLKRQIPSGTAHATVSAPLSPATRR